MNVTITNVMYLANTTLVYITIINVFLLLVIILLCYLLH